VDPTDEGFTGTSETNDGGAAPTKEAFRGGGGGGVERRPDGGGARAAGVVGRRRQIGLEEEKREKGAEPRAEDGGAGQSHGQRTDCARQIHVRPEKVGTSFCLHFVLFSSRDY
jgi:hypothetical protein